MMMLLRFYNAQGLEVGWLYAIGTTSAERYASARERKALWRAKGVKV